MEKIGTCHRFPTCKVDTLLTKVSRIFIWTNFQNKLVLSEAFQDTSLFSKVTKWGLWYPSKDFFVFFTTIPQRIKTFQYLRFPCPFASDIFFSSKIEHEESFMLSTLSQFRKITFSDRYGLANNKVITPPEIVDIFRFV